MSVKSDMLTRTRIAPELAEAFGTNGKHNGPNSKAIKAQRHRVIIEMNSQFPGGEQPARLVLIRKLGLTEAVERLQTNGRIAMAGFATEADVTGRQMKIDPSKFRLLNSLQTDRFLFASLTWAEIKAIANMQASVPILDPGTSKTKAWTGPLVYKLWLDNPLSTLVYVSSRTIKCDAAQVAFKSAGRDIVWAVADTGVAPHPHFQMNENLQLPDGLQHRDFTGDDDQPPLEAQLSALQDSDGHGTHVAGIIAGQTEAADGGPEIVIENDAGVSQIAGVAPHCKIMSLKVLKNDGQGSTEALLAAIAYIQTLNGYGRRIRVHGLNISLGYDFKPTNFAAGQSTLCAEVNRLVKCGVSVVVAAGNGGGGFLSADGGGSTRAAFQSTITDPGNADFAITVGSTHRDRPVTYGVSYFSAKGPTIDGRMKPDLVAPGEHIVSCDAQRSVPGRAAFCAKSGTSMAAPHVSGAIAAFLSVRGEFRGQPELVKRLFMDNATNLGRRPEFQGAGLIDLMRTLQAI